MTYNLRTNMAQATMELSQALGLDTACNLVDSLKAQDYQALKIDVIEGQASTSVSLSLIKDYFAYTNGNQPIGD